MIRWVRAHIANLWDAYHGGADARISCRLLERQVEQRLQQRHVEVVLLLFGHGCWRVWRQPRNARIRVSWLARSVGGGL